MDKQPRHSPANLRRADVPTDPGAYAWYRAGEPVYVGKATSLRNRLWRNHLGRGRVMTGSAFRRNVAEELGIATAAAIKRRDYQTTDHDAADVREYIDSCEVAWLPTETAEGALELETALKSEWSPPLTRR